MKTKRESTFSFLIYVRYVNTDVYLLELRNLKKLCSDGLANLFKITEPVSSRAHICQTTKSTQSLSTLYYLKQLGVIVSLGE